MARLSCKPAEGIKLQDTRGLVSLNQYHMYAGMQHMNFRVAIITGVSRSGKTLLGQLLGSMRNVEHVDEPWLPMMLPVMQGKGLIDREVAKTLLQSFTEELFNDTILLRRANFRPLDRSSIWTCKGAQEIFPRLVNLHSRDDVRRYVRENDSVLLYNLAETIPFLSFLVEAFPHCKIIHVVRNGLDVALAAADKQWFSDAQLKNPLNNQVFKLYQSIDRSSKYHLPWWLQEEDTELFLSMGDFARGLCYWRSLLEQSQEQIAELKAAHPHIYHEVKYEELVRSPVQILNNIATFLDVAPSEQTASVSSTIEDQTTFDSSIYPLAQVPERETERVIKMLNAFNYPTAGLW